MVIGGRNNKLVEVMFLVDFLGLFGGFFVGVCCRLMEEGLKIFLVNFRCDLRDENSKRLRGIWC